MKTLIQTLKESQSRWNRAFLTLCLSGACWTSLFAQTAGVTSHPRMHLSEAQMQQMMADHLQATPQAVPQSQGDMAAAQAAPPASFSLLSQLPYIPAQRNQGDCGDCWAWAGTGVMEIAHAVNNGVSSRLSVQLLNSCNPWVSCCGGGWLANVTQFYSYEGFAVPWSNTNASWQSGNGECADFCGNIATNPCYRIRNLSAVTIPTWGVSTAQSIANIKNALNQSNAIWFAFFMATATDWDNFDTFWDTETESAHWTNFYSGQTADFGLGGHAVLCVGYDDTDPAGPCWIMVNSWGTTAERTNGLFRVAQNLNYDSTYSTGGHTYQSLYFETLDVQFVAPPTPPTLALSLTATNTVALSWTVSATGFSVQQTSALNSAEWVTLTNAPTVVNGQNVVVLPKGSGNSFFRLAAAP